MQQVAQGSEIAGRSRSPRVWRAVRGQAVRGALRCVEARLGWLCELGRVLPAITACRAAAERTRLVASVERGEAPEPRWQYAPVPVPAAAFRSLDALRAEVGDLPGASLHMAKLHELELDLRIVAAVGNAAVVRPLAASRFGTGAALVPVGSDGGRLAQWARKVLSGPPAVRESRTVPPEGPMPSVGAIARTLAAEAGLSIDVRVEPMLAAGAASADRTMFVADRWFGAREARRLAVHEVLGHLVAADCGRRQPLRVLEWGTAGAFGDQEGVGLHLEAAHGLMDVGRLRTIAARVVATDAMHAGASFGETARSLVREHGFDARDAVAVAERAYRGGGVARDAAYAYGYLRVQDALARGAATLDELRVGRVGLDALPAVRELARNGWAVI
jgi:hypothetical protein